MTGLLDYSEVAKRLNVSKMTVKRFILRGTLPVVRFSKKVVRVPEDQLVAFIQNGGIYTPEAKKG